MQTLARDGYTTAQITALLQAPALEVDKGCDLLNPDLTLREDITDDLVSGKVARNSNATIHGTCELSLSRVLKWGVDLVRPYMVLSDGGTTARFNVGVYLLTTPNRQIGEVPETFTASGFDRVMLLNREVGADYSVAVGTTYRKALLDTFAAAGLTGALIEGSAANDTLPKARIWPLVGTSTDPDQTDTPVTWLRIINDLLRAINFRNVWADENGVFRCQEYKSPVDSAAEFVFDADDENTTIVAEERTIIEDVWDTPNRWVFRQTNRPEGAPVATEGDGIHTIVNQSDGITSIDQRGLVWTRVFDYEAATHAKLVALGKRRVTLDRRVTTRLKAKTGPFPVAGHEDLYQFIDAASGGSRKVQAPQWSFDLGSSDVEWDWEVVV